MPDEALSSCFKNDRPHDDTVRAAHGPYFPHIGRYGLILSGNTVIRVRAGSTVINAPAARSSPMALSAAAIRAPIVSGLTSSARTWTTLGLSPWVAARHGWRPDRAEVQVMGQYDIIMSPRMGHDDDIRRVTGPREDQCSASNPTLVKYPTQRGERFMSMRSFTRGSVQPRAPQPSRPHSAAPGGCLPVQGRGNPPGDPRCFGRRRSVRRSCRP